jgi:hypothetical protein
VAQVELTLPKRGWELPIHITCHYWIQQELFCTISEHISNLIPITARSWGLEYIEFSYMHLAQEPSS